MALAIKLVRFVMRALGLLVKVKAHTRLGGVIKVVEYWRHAV